MFQSMYLHLLGSQQATKTWLQSSLKLFPLFD